MNLVDRAFGASEFSDAEEPGIFTWELATDKVYADSALANLFGLDPEQTLTGLPVIRYLDRIHPDDKPSVAKAISESVITGNPYRCDYRVFDRSGQIVAVAALGRCFRDEDGNPSQYAGIVFPTNDHVQRDELSAHCSAALKIARSSGLQATADALEAILKELAKPMPSDVAQVH
ncbi:MULTISPECIES: PAS domain-containing protein [Rhizobium]|jgi:PAS domain-containing protein|uniref:histidine kinase n=2 Tax=Rhizobium TaxID=379 RepID=A0A7M3DV87_RHILE|nr:PAS domain-containing protein [Rhizobium leguminosarum]MDH6273088.1 PAS domain-containing protein [Rhizobium leguminosarum]MDI5925176.1 PAS domain-containing protein [Rhizobium leguminosarum]MDV4165572.1 PAS domain-containing protein [Rhizobium leguminosarum]MDV4176046.1 PAS domain-containing protein [Rhizobium leguminosarum]MVO94749.1 PAS domain-containing protein [Rhizobium leguminosarum bv. phaseoli]